MDLQREERIADICDRQAITDVLHRYCRAVDRLDHELLSNITIELQGDSAHVESYVVAVHAMAGNAIEQAGARYIDRFERRDGEWRIARRVAVIDWYVTGSRGAPSAHLDAFLRGRRDRTDPVYQPGAR